MCRVGDCAIFMGKAVFCDRCGGAFARESEPRLKVEEKAPVIEDSLKVGIKEESATPITV